MQIRYKFEGKVKVNLWIIQEIEGAIKYNPDLSSIYPSFCSYFWVNVGHRWYEYKVHLKALGCWIGILFFRWMIKLLGQCNLKFLLLNSSFSYSNSILTYDVLCWAEMWLYSTSKSSCYWAIFVLIAVIKITTTRLYIYKVEECEEVLLCGFIFPCPSDLGKALTGFGLGQVGPQFSLLEFLMNLQQVVLCLFIDPQVSKGVLLC